MPGTLRGRPRQHGARARAGINAAFAKHGVDGKAVGAGSQH
jgi:hypothetical protein